MEFPSIKKVIIYGSRALNREKSGSDIDLTLEGENLDHHTLIALLKKLDDSTLPYLFDISIRSEIENSSLKSHIERVGKVFYEKS